MIHRLMNIHMNTENFQKELNILKQIAVINGFNPHIIDGILKNKNYKQDLKSFYLIIKDYPNNNDTSIAYKKLNKIIIL